MEGGRHERSVHTVASHALVYEAVEQRATVVAEGRAGVGVNLKFMLCPRVLESAKAQIRCVLFSLFNRKSLKTFVKDIEQIHLSFIPIPSFHFFAH